MRLSFRLSSFVRLAALTAVIISCTDSPTEPVGEAPVGSIRLSDSVYTRGAVIRAGLGAPDGYAVVPGSATWSVVTGGATLTTVSGPDDLVDVMLTGAGTVQLRSTYALRRLGVGSNLSIAAPSRRPGGDVMVEVSKTIVVAAPVIDYVALPTASVTAGGSLGGIQVALKDSRGRILTMATDSIVISVDPTSGGTGAVLLGALRARPNEGVASFPGLSIQKAGVGYRLIASSPTLLARDTATTTIVAGAPVAGQTTLAVADTAIAVAGTSTVTVTVRDQYGNPVLTATPAAFTASTTAGTLGAFTCANGVCTATYTAANTPGTPAISATVGATAVSGAPKTIRVRPGSAATLRITGDSTQAAGSSKNVTITAYDAFSNVATGYTGAKSLTFSGAANSATGLVPTIGGQNVGTAVNVTFADGVATLVAALLVKSETATLATTDGTISAAGADRLEVRVFATPPVITGPSGAAGATASEKTIDENTTAVHTFTADKASTWTLSGADAARFSITAGGALAFIVAPDFETPLDLGDTAGNNTYVVVVSAADSLGDAAPQTVTVTVADIDDTPPAIQGPSGAAGAANSAVSIVENTTAVFSFTKNEAGPWTLTGPDAEQFAITAAGELTFLAAPDFEAPTDAGDTAGNNTYVLEVRATDAAGNVAIQTVTVTVTDYDEIPPSIQGPSGGAGAATTEASVVEGTTAVYTFTANEPVTWTLLDAADGTRFTLSAEGALSFNVAPDFENPTDGAAGDGLPLNNVYVVRVRAVDAVGNTSTQTVVITVTNQPDETAPVITGPTGGAGASTSAKTIDENTTAVHGFTASEAVTWSISGGADAAKFTISSAGALAFTAAPDFETPTDVGATAGNNTYVVVITATDAVGNVATQTVTVTVADVDDTAPLIGGPSGIAGAATSAKSIPENSTAVHTFLANEAVTWTLTAGDDAAKFNITAGGVLSFTSAPDFETPTDVGDTAGNNTYVVRVTATDGTGNTATQTVTVTVTNLDDAAPIITGPSGAAGATTSETSIAENTTAVHTFASSEPAGWSITGGADAATFAIDPATGALRFIAAPDFEAPTDLGAGAGNNTYVVVVTAQDLDGNTSSQTVTVTVTDVDDVAPVITGPSGGAGAATSATSIVENTTSVHTFTSSESVTWSLTGPDVAKFSIDASGALRFILAPDFEVPQDAGDTPNNNTYVVGVVATDAAGNISTQTITVTVTDIDDVAPVITGPSGDPGAATSVKSIPENSSAVHTFTSNELVTWTLAGADAAKFTITAGGDLSFTSAPDFETPNDIGAGANNNTYVVTVRATDGVGRISTQIVTVTVTDVDEIVPVITGPSGAAGAASSTKSVAENTTAVHTFTASEPVTFTITGGADAAKFAVTAGGALSFVAAPDFETPTDLGDTAGNNTYVVILTATDAVGLTATQTVTVTVTDADDTAPSITGPSGAAGAATSTKSVNENTTAVHTMTANETVTWTIGGGADAARFVISAAGTLRFAPAPDFENPLDLGDTPGNNTYVVVVTATDASGNASTQTITVTVLDVDDVTPDITGPSGGAGATSSATSIPENTTSVHTFTASEAVTWSIGGADAAKFTITAGGALSFSSAPDFETPTDVGATAGNNTYVVEVSATDAAGNLATQTVTVTVTDVDDTAPLITGPSGAAGAATSSKSIVENTTAVHTFTANEAVTWTLGGADAATFSITAGGVLTFLAAPDFETPTDLGDTAGNNTYVVTITGTDAAGNPSTQTLTVTVTDIDDTAPLITGPSGAAGAATSAKSAPENQTTVHTFSANESVTWSITGGADAAKFAINATTGALTFVAAPDFEAPTDAGDTALNNTYVVIITATDGATLTSTQTVTVTVTDVDDTKPAIQGPSGGPGAAFSLKSIPENTTAVHTFDADEAVTWSLVADADGAKFSVDATTGALRFVTAPDFEAPTDVVAGDGIAANNIYVVNILAVDAAGNISTQAVTVTVTNIADEIAPVITGPTGGAGAATSTASIAENTTAVHTFGVSEAVTWTLSGADAAKFTITAGGALSFVSAPDFETPTDVGAGAGNNTYVVTLTATDAGGNTATQTVTITVTDAAELSLSVSAQPSVAVNEVTERIIYTVRNGAVRQAVASATTFNLTASGGGSFFSDVDGTALITSATIPAAQDSFVVYYRQAAGAGTTTTLTATRTTGDVIPAASTPMNVIATAAAASRLDGVICSATTGNSPKATLTTTAGCTAAAGQLLVMVFGHSPTNNPFDMPTFTAPAGWTQLRTTGPVSPAGSVVNLRSNVYYRVATTAGDYTPTFTASAGTVRMSFVIVAVNSPNAIPVDTDAAEGSALATTTIRIPAATATEAGAMLLAYAVQDIGSTAMAVPAGLSPVGIFDQGGQMVSIGIFSKDRIFPGATPRYGVTTAQDTNASVAGSVILKP